MLSHNYERFVKGHNPCFSRILFAMNFRRFKHSMESSHNPCFSRILFAIGDVGGRDLREPLSQSLF